MPPASRLERLELWTARHAACSGVRATRAPGCGVATAYGVGPGRAGALQSGGRPLRGHRRVQHRRPRSGGQATATIPGARGIEPVAPGASGRG